jgi:hypothetical protein
VFNKHESAFSLPFFCSEPLKHDVTANVVVKRAVAKKPATPLRRLHLQKGSWEATFDQLFECFFGFAIKSWSPILSV